MVWVKYKLGLYWDQTVVRKGMGSGGEGHFLNPLKPGVWERLVVPGGEGVVLDPKLLFRG